jgi:hypothetical protein
VTVWFAQIKIVHGEEGWHFEYPRMILAYADQTRFAQALRLVTLVLDVNIFKPIAL